MAPLDHLSELALAFPRFFADQPQAKQRETLATYARNLADFPDLVVASACAQLVRTEEWFPSIAKIRLTCAERMLQLPDEHEALAQIEARSRWARLEENERGDPPPLSDLVRRVLSLCGGFPAWRATEDQAVLRGQFGRLYREARARRVRECQIGELSLPAAPERKQLAS